MLGKPARCLGLCNDDEDFDGFDRDVIENSYLSDPKAILWLTQTPEPLDSALARPSRLLQRVPFQSIPHFGAILSWQNLDKPLLRPGARTVSVEFEPEIALDLFPGL